MERDARNSHFVVLYEKRNEDTSQIRHQHGSRRNGLLAAQWRGMGCRVLVEVQSRRACLCNPCSHCLPVVLHHRSAWLAPRHATLLCAHDDPVFHGLERYHYTDLDSNETRKTEQEDEQTIHNAFPDRRFKP